MIITVQEFKEYHSATVSDAVLAAKLSAIETLIRKCTNNDFQRIEFRCKSAIMDGVIVTPSPYFRIGDTVQVTRSGVNDGLYVIGTGNTLMPTPYDSDSNVITKIVYPDDVKMGAIEILGWILRNSAENDGTARKIQSETISRHSVTYASDSSENDIDTAFGVPKKYTAFLNHYIKARF